MIRLALQIIWPAFMMAGVLEMLIFVVVDPRDMQWFSAAPIGLSPQAIYTVTFVLCWLVISVSTAITVLLMREGD